MYHIKRDAAFLCKQDICKYGKSFIKLFKPNHISFSQAHKTKLDTCCPDCTKRYYEILDKLKNPIIL